ncbi:MAG TPA: fumarylacetoacetate hydrolase family protein, partial [Candidatus Binatus sp.]|nr:fumarylacetoacetate hydrolase family protein [Candidatus Binatus sp.]
PRLAGMRIGHVRERHAPAGAPWRLGVSGGPVEAAGLAGSWLDAEVVRRRLVAADARLAHNSALFRQPLSTTDDLFARGIRLAALAELLDAFAAAGGPRDPEDDALLDADDLRFGPPVVRAPAFRDFYAFERHVRTMWERRGGEIPEAWYRLPIFYFSGTSEIRGPGDPVWSPAGSSELDFELEVGAVVDTPLFDAPAERAEEAIGGYFVLADWSARDLQRDETVVRLGPAKGKDFATSIGPWIVTPDELASARTTGAMGPDVAMTATVVDAAGRAIEVSRGTWASAHFSFGQMLERASADVHIRAGEIVGSGTVGGGCLLEVKDATLGRWLQPGDQVRLAIERIGELVTPIIAKPSA